MNMGTCMKKTHSPNIHVKRKPFSTNVCEHWITSGWTSVNQAAVQTLNQCSQTLVCIIHPGLWTAICSITDNGDGSWVVGEIWLIREKMVIYLQDFCLVCCRLSLCSSWPVIPVYLLPLLPKWDFASYIIWNKFGYANVHCHKHTYTHTNIYIYLYLFST